VVRGETAATKGPLSLYTGYTAVRGGTKGRIGKRKEKNVTHPSDRKKAENCPFSAVRGTAKEN